MPSVQHLEDQLLQSSQALVPAGKRRGRPAQLSNVHLCLGIVLCGLQGFGAQLQLWRRLCLEPIGPFAPVAVVDQAVEAGSTPAPDRHLQRVQGELGVEGCSHTPAHDPVAESIQD